MTSSTWRGWFLTLFGVGLAFAALSLDWIRGQPVELGAFQLLVLLFGGLLAAFAILFRIPWFDSRVGFLYTAAAAFIGASAGLTKDAALWAVAGSALLLAAAGSSGDGGRALRMALGDEWRDLRRRGWIFVLAVVQLLLAAAVIRLYHIESQAFYDTVLAMIVAGFLLVQVVPGPWRLAFFSLFSLGGIGVVLGPTNTLALLLVSAALLGAAHLPLPFKVRVALLLALSVLLVIWRGGWWTGPVPAAVWPILGSIFMFRLIVYMYDLSHQKEPVRWSRVFAYFFMLPNVVFPFFPAIDYTLFRRTWYDTEAETIHRKGLHFILAGVTHLILYRAVSYYLMISPEKITGLMDLARYLLANFLLYLRVSGQFHLIIGILHLFGCHLPETHRGYFLAAGFTDLWRRINIYWKDFMLKIFYYPILFRLKAFGPIKSMVMATMLVFILTWAFHAYQWFWLRGTWLWSLPDMLFWAILGLFVVVNSVIEIRHGRRRSLTAARVPWSERLLHGAAVAATFSTMMILWSLWSSPTVADWASLWSTLKRHPVDSSLLLGGGLIGFLALAVGPAGSAPKPVSRLAAANAARAVGGGIATGGGKTAAPHWHSRLGLGTLAGLLALTLLAQPPIVDRLPSDAGTVLQNVRWARLNDRDAAQMERGYYEGLNAVNNFNNDLWQIYMHRPDEVPIWETEAARQRDDYLATELNPGVSILFRGKAYQTNRWAMRDGEYEKARPDGVVRVALIGDSHTEGWGVANTENFDHGLEQALAEKPLRAGMPRVELMNFAVGGYTPIQELMTLEHKALEFNPDVVFVFGHPGDRERAVYHFWQQTAANRTAPYPEMADIVTRSGIDPKTPQSQALRQLNPFGDEALAWIYARMVAACRARNVRPVWVLIPASPGQARPPHLPGQLEQVRAAGFEIIDIFDVYDGHDPKAIRVADWDQHPNPLGHRLIVDKLYAALAARPELLSTLSGAGGSGTD